MNEMAIKFYDIDYTSIIRNYLNVRLWDNVWTVLEYKQYKITMNLYSINTKNRYVVLEYFITDELDNRINHDINIYLRDLNMNVVQKQINGVLFKLIESLEIERIKDSYKYKEMRKYVDFEYETISDRITEYCEDNDIEKESKIDKIFSDFYEEHNILSNFTLSYLEEMKYVELRDLYEVVLDITKDETRKRYVESKKHIINADDIYYEFLEQKEYYESDEYSERLEVIINEL